MKRLARQTLLTTATGILTLALFAGCKTNSGSKEYRPGKGWKNADRGNPISLMVEGRAGACLGKGSGGEGCLPQSSS